MRGENLFLDATDGQNFAAQRDLAGHGHVATNRNMRERTHNWGADGDAGRGAIFRNSAFGNVHVDVEMTVKSMRQTKSRRARPHIAHGRLRGFLHYVTEFTGEREPPLAVH